jgi:predicted transcriptional regulator
MNFAMWWLKRQSAGPWSALEQLGSLESALMKRIWMVGECSVRELHQELSLRLAYTTVMTTLDRLYKKGLLKRRKSGKAFLYSAALSEEAYRETLAQHLIGMALEDGKSNHAVLSHFVEAVSESDQQMLDRLDQLVRAKRRALHRTEAP